MVLFPNSGCGSGGAVLAGDDDEGTVGGAVAAGEAATVVVLATDIADVISRKNSSSVGIFSPERRALSRSDAAAAIAALATGGSPLSTVSGGPSSLSSRPSRARRWRFSGA